MDVQKIFQGISNKLIVDFAQIQNQISHSGEKGNLRERSIRDILQKYLPKKYSIGTGHILDYQGNISRQCDIVIYDSLNCPVLLVEDGYQAFPVESVIGVVEVKSVLNGKTVAESIENIRSVKCLLRDAPVIGVVFAFESGYSKEPKIEAVANAFRRLNDSIEPRERVDLVCVLSQGMILEYKIDPPYGLEHSTMDVFYEIIPPTLLLFLFYLIMLLEQRKSSMPDLLSYALKGGGEIGYVKRISSASK